MLGRERNGKERKEYIQIRFEEAQEYLEINNCGYSHRLNLDVPGGTLAVAVRVFALGQHC